MPFLRIREIVDDLNSLGGMTGAHHALITELVAICLSAGPKPKSGAQRTAEWRERNRCDDVTSHVTGVTGEGKKESPPHPQKKNINIPPCDANASHPPKAKKAFRLPENWHPSETLWAWGKAKLGLSDEFLRFETGAFRDHWYASGGKNAAKLDWDRAWMNWMREAVRRRGKVGGPPRVPAKEAHFTQAVQKHMERVHARNGGSDLRSEGGEHDFRQLQPPDHQRRIDARTVDATANGATESGGEPNV